MSFLEKVFNFLLTLVALSLAGVVFLIKNEITIPFDRFFNILLLSNWPSYIIYFCICIFLAWITLQYPRLLGGERFSIGSIVESELANDAYLPTFLGYFFVALSIEKVEIFAYVFGIISIFIFFSRAAYFNPLYFLFGFRFYSMKTSEGVKILVLTRKPCKIPKQIEFQKIRRINNYIFIDIG